MWVLRTTLPTWEAITLGVEFNHRPVVVVGADGEGLVDDAGSRLLAELADRSGLEAWFAAAVRQLANTRATTTRRGYWWTWR
jgi:hypothetical protein